MCIRIIVSLCVEKYNDDIIARELWDQICQQLTTLVPVRLYSGIDNGAKRYSIRNQEILLVIQVNFTSDQLSSDDKPELITSAPASYCDNTHWRGKKFHR